MKSEVQQAVERHIWMESVSASLLGQKLVQLVPPLL